MMKQFAWGILPYIAFTFLIVGTIVRYTVSERNWTTKSSQFLSKSDLKIAGPMFHLGLVMALGGGAPAGILFFGGFVLLLIRRFGKDRMAVNTSTMDKWLYLFLFLAIFTGCASTTLNAVQGGFDYRETISPWFRSVLALSPEIDYMENVPLMFRIHMFSWMAVAFLFPFTRLVHCLSAPFEYLVRSPIIYRKK